MKLLIISILLESFRITTSNKPSETSAFGAALNPPPKNLPLAITHIVTFVTIVSLPSSIEISHILLSYVGKVETTLEKVEINRLLILVLIFFDLSMISPPMPISAALRNIRVGNNNLV